MLYIHSLSHSCLRKPRKLADPVKPTLALKCHVKVIQGHAFYTVIKKADKVLHILLYSNVALAVEIPMIWRPNLLKNAVLMLDPHFRAPSPRIYA